MEKSITLTLTKTTLNRLDRLALSYGLSITDFTKHVLEEISSNIPEESLTDYKKPTELTSSIKRGIKDWKAGHVRSKL